MLKQISRLLIGIVALLPMAGLFVPSIALASPENELLYYYWDKKSDTAQITNIDTTYFFENSKAQPWSFRKKEANGQYSYINIADHSKPTEGLYDVQSGTTIKVRLDAGSAEDYFKPYIAKYGAQANPNINPNRPNLGPAVQAPSTTPTENVTPGEETDKDECAEASGTYSWMLCPAVKQGTDFLEQVYASIIEPLLKVDPLNTDSDLYFVWKQFVALANVLFVVAFLVLIFGTSLNMNAYTVKKALPRLVIAAVAVQFSFFLVGFIIDIGNVFGSGIQSLVAEALTRNNQEVSHELAKNLISGGVAVFVGGASLFVAAAFFGPALVLMLIGLVISVFTFIFTLIVRKLLINVLILLAPLAFVAWILPNTENYFEKWRSNFFKVIWVYPIISLILAAGFIIQQAAVSTVAALENSSLAPIASNTELFLFGAANGQLNQLIAGIAPMLAFFMMPMAFKWSGSAMGMTGKAIGRMGGRAASAGQKKFASSEKASDMQLNARDRKLRSAAKLSSLGENRTGLAGKGLRGLGSLGKVGGSVIGIPASATAQQRDFQNTMKEARSDLDLLGVSDPTTLQALAHGDTDKLKSLGRNDLAAMAKNRSVRMAAMQKKGELKGLDESDLQKIASQPGTAEQKRQVLRTVMSGEAYRQTRAVNPLVSQMAIKDDGTLETKAEVMRDPDKMSRARQSITAESLSKFNNAAQIKNLVDDGLLTADMADRALSSSAKKNMNAETIAALESIADGGALVETVDVQRSYSTGEARNSVQTSDTIIAKQALAKSTIAAHAAAESARTGTQVSAGSLEQAYFSDPIFQKRVDEAVKQGIPINQVPEMPLTPPTP